MNIMHHLPLLAAARLLQRPALSLLILLAAHSALHAGASFVAGKGGGEDWKIIGDLSEPSESAPYVTAADSKKPVWLLSTKAFSGNYRIEAVVQLVPRVQGKSTRWPQMTLAWGVQAKDKALTIGREIAYSGEGVKGYSLALVGVRPPDPQGKKVQQLPGPEGFDVTRTYEEPSMDGISHTDRTFLRWRTTMRVRPAFTPEDVSPVWDEQFRLAAERDYAALPLTAEVWAKIRVEVTPKWARVYRNGLFFLELPAPPPTDGRVLLQVPSGVRLASLEVGAYEPPAEGFYPVPLEEIVNASGMLDEKSLPVAGGVKTLDGVPFLFPPRGAAGDHVDIGASLFRFREASGAYPTFSSPRMTWRSATTLDPGRLMLRVPNRAYGKLWVVAAADEDPLKVPVLTVRFFKPEAGFAIDAEKAVPLATATSDTAGARRVEVKGRDGKVSSLWIVPVDLDTGRIASSFRNASQLDIELTKKVYDYRAFPDPVTYDSFQGGLPSGVRVYAATLEEAPFRFLSDGDRTGKIYTTPEQPGWEVKLDNLSGRPEELGVKLVVKGPEGYERTLEKKAKVGARGEGSVKFALEPGKFGHYTVGTTVSGAGVTQQQEGSFVYLPPDRRKATAETTRWGLWYWMYHEVGMDQEANLKMLRAMGALTGCHAPYELRKKYGIGPASEKLSIRRLPWAETHPDDPEKVAEFVATAAEKTREHLKNVPDLEYMLPYAEQMVSLRITHGMPPWALGQPPFDFTEREKMLIKAYIAQSQAGDRGVKEVSPEIETMLGSCAAVFAIPLLEAGVAKESFDGIGLDLPQFERMPERQPRATEPSLLYFGREARDRLGYGDKGFYHFESYFPSSHPLANGERGHAQSIVRTAALSLALGSERFIECWTFQDPSDYWGSSHYAGGGMLGRLPEFNPKPGAVAFATMTQVLDTAVYDGYIPTGSLSSYCVRFKDPDKMVYALWTFHGARPATVTVPEGTKLVKVDEGGNESEVEVVQGRAEVELSPTPIWLLARGGAVEKVEVGTPVYEGPGQEPTVLLENFERADWTYSREPYPLYAENHWDVRRLPGGYKLSFEDSAERGTKVMKASLESAGEGPLVGWYGVFTPPRPIDIPGKARALGLWAKGNSGWGRVIYELVDAQGQKLLNIGTKDEFNCDDIHSWSNLNFDGWKYTEFPLPGNLPGDDYREKDSVWWNHTEQKPVKLPLKLTRIIVEMPKNIIYINEMLPVENQGVELDELVAVYDSEEMKGAGAAELAAAAAGMYQVDAADSSVLPNPIKELASGGGAAATKILDVVSPEMQNDGTRARVKVAAVPGAQSYKIWLSAYPDGAGAKAAGVTPASDAPHSLLVRGLAPAVPLYLFATYLDADGKESKPSPARKVVLKDEFPFK